MRSSSTHARTHTTSSFSAPRRTPKLASIPIPPLLLSVQRLRAALHARSRSATGCPARNLPSQNRSHARKVIEGRVIVSRRPSRRVYFLYEYFRNSIGIKSEEERSRARDVRSRRAFERKWESERYRSAIFLFLRATTA